MRVQGFHHLAIQVQQVEKMAVFYREAFGFAEIKRHHRDDGSLRSIWLAVGEGFLALEATEMAPSPAPFRDGHPGFHLLALKISARERAAFVGRLSALGVSVEHQTQWTVYVRDPEGNRIGLSHHPEDPVPASS